MSDRPTTAAAVPEVVNGWRVRHMATTANKVHHTMPGDDTGPEVWIHRPPGPALVLGSAQPDGLVHLERAAAAEIEVCRRRSGGGLVHLDPLRDCWIDLIVPAGSEHWHDDLGRAFHWVGERWAAVLAELTAASPTVHRDAPSSPLGRVWCFGATGHGEVTIGGTKVVGLSQRRTRHWLRLQCLVLARWEVETLRHLVDPAVARRHRPKVFADIDPAELAADQVRAGFPAGIEAPAPDLLAATFVASLPPP